MTGKVPRKAEPLKRPLREISRSHLTEHVQRLWDHYSIPEFHRQLYLQRFGADDYSLDVLHREVGALAKGIAPVQRAMRAIANREEILLRLGVLRGAFADAEFSVPGSLARCELSEQLYSLRMATVEAILALVAWRHSVAPRAGPTCIAGPGARGASWPFTAVNGESWPDYFMHIASNDAAVRQFQNVAELSKDCDPLLVHASVGGVGPFQGGKLCPPCCDAMHRQNLDRARLSLLEDELASALFHPGRAGTPQDNKSSSWSTPSPDLRPEEDFPSRPSSRLLQELAGPPLLPPLKDAPTPSVTPPPVPPAPPKPASQWASQTEASYHRAGRDRRPASLLDGLTVQPPKSAVATLVHEWLEGGRAPRGAEGVDPLVANRTKVARDRTGPWPGLSRTKLRHTAR